MVSVVTCNQIHSSMVFMFISAPKPIAIHPSTPPEILVIRWAIFFLLFRSWAGPRFSYSESLGTRKTEIKSVRCFSRERKKQTNWKELRRGFCRALTMPIKWILHWQPNPGATVNTQILSEVSQCAESFNGVKEGRWKSSLSIYKAMVRDQMAGNEFPRDFVGISLAEQPNSYFLVIRGQRLVVEAESSIQTIMEKLQSYKTRVALCFEGNQYRLGDFLLRVGKVVPMHSESLRGIVMEMEYLPISSWEKSHEIMAELLDLWQEALSKRSLPGHFVHIGPNFAEYGLTDQYSLQHTAVQYASITMISQSVQPARN